MHDGQGIDIREESEPAIRIWIDADGLSPYGEGSLAVDFNGEIVNDKCQMPHSTGFRSTHRAGRRWK